MTQNMFRHLASGVVVTIGLLSAGAGYAQSDLSPAKSNCDSKTGCANYSTGNVTSKNPMQQTNSNSPYDQGGTNPAQSNCDSKTGCASYSTGDQTKANPANPMPPQK
ncbi:MAG TPA: hypothetical protein VGF92_19270 [Stellaceae bacterium]|jgi:hypothetical protein